MKDKSNRVVTSDFMNMVRDEYNDSLPKGLEPVTDDAVSRFFKAQESVFMCLILKGKRVCFRRIGSFFLKRHSAKNVTFFGSPVRDYVVVKFSPSLCLTKKVRTLDRDGNLPELDGAEEDAVSEA